MSYETSECRDMKELVKALVALGEQRVQMIQLRPAEMESFSFSETKRRSLVRLEFGFETLIQKTVSLGLFCNPNDFVFRNRGSTWFRDGILTPAGRSHFGRVFRRQGRLDFDVGGVKVRFRATGQGNSRRFVVTSFSTLQAPRTV